MIKKTRVKVTLKEMTDAEVSHVSLVKRGANLIPFRVLKSDDGTATLGDDDMTVHITRKPKGLELVTVIARKQYGPALAIALKAMGLSDKGEESEDFVSFIQTDKVTKEDRTFGIQYRNGITAIYKGEAPGRVEAQKGYWPTSLGENFSENIVGQGFCVGASTALDVLNATIGSIMGQATSLKEAKADFERAIGSFKDYFMGLVETLPTTAFKFEDLKLEATKGDDMTKPEKIAQKDWDAMSETDKQKAIKAVADVAGGGRAADADVDADAKAKADADVAASAATAAADAAAAATAAADKATADAAAADKPEEVQKAILAALTALNGKVDAASARVEGVAKSVQTLNDGHTALTTKLTEVENVAKATDAKLKGTLIGGGDDEDGRQPVRKSTSLWGNLMPGLPD